MNMLVVCFLVILLLGIAVEALSSSDQKTVQLNKWLMWSTATPNSTVYPFTAPGTVFGNLLQHTNIYPKNILEGNQLKHVDPSPFSVPWVFSWRCANFPHDIFPNASTESSPPPSQERDDRYIIRFKGINYKADLQVNGINVVTSKDFVGTFREFSFDITDHIASTTASSSSSAVEVSLLMTPPVDNVFPPINPSTDLARTWIDWAPPPPDASMGIWREVELIKRTTSKNTSSSSSSSRISHKNRNTKIPKSTIRKSRLAPSSVAEHAGTKTKQRNSNNNEPHSVFAIDPCFGGELRYPQVSVKLNQATSTTNRPLEEYQNVQLEVDAVFEIPLFSSPSSSSLSSSNFTLTCQLSLPSDSARSPTASPLQFRNRHPIVIDPSSSSSSSSNSKSWTISASLINNSNNSRSDDSSSSATTTTTTTITTLHFNDLWWPWQMDPVNQRLSVVNFDKLVLKEPNFASLSCQLAATSLSSFSSASSSASLSSSTTCASSIANQKIGLRQSESRIVNIADQQPVRQFFINKVPILVRGAGWAPQLFYNDSAEDYDTTFLYVRAMNLNAVRLEGKFPHDSFYETADRYGVLVLEGFSCCDAWQHWANWTSTTYVVANESLRYQLRRLRRFASVSAFFYSSDELPPQDVEAMYLKTFDQEKWVNVKISSAANVTSNISSHSGVKMSGPYSIVPPNYWTLAGENFFLGGNFGFLTEGGPGENPAPYLSQLQMTNEATSGSATNVSALFPAGTSEVINYHMGNPAGLFYDLRFYNPFLDARYGKPQTPFDFAEYSQLVNYESQTAYQDSYNGGKYQATGYVQWMLNSAWPSNLWNLYDYYYTPGGAFFGTQNANRFIFVADNNNNNNNNNNNSNVTPFAVAPWLDWSKLSVSIFNGAYTPVSNVTVVAEVFLLFLVPSPSVFEMKSPSINIHHYSETSSTIPLVDSDAVVKSVLQINAPAQNPNQNSGSTKVVQLIRVTTRATTATSANSHAQIQKLYWRSAVRDDVLEWDQSNFYRTPCKQFADLSPLAQVVVDHQDDVTTLENVRGVTISACRVLSTRNVNNDDDDIVVRVNVTKRSVTQLSASFLLLANFEVIDQSTVEPVRPILWDDNFISMLPGAAQPTDTNRVLHARILMKKNRQGGNGIAPLSNPSNLMLRMRNLTFSIGQYCM